MYRIALTALLAAAAQSSPTYDVTRESLVVRSGKVALPATLFKPTGVRRPAVAIYVQGRGCGPVTGAERQGEYFAAKGLAVLVYDKRGADSTARPCAFATIADLARDVEAIATVLRKRDDLDPNRVGTISNSAGGWVSAKASSGARLAFMAMFVGPATSVEAQQVTSARELAHRMKLSPTDSAQAVEYTQLMFAKTSQAKRFEQLSRLHEAGKKSGWAQKFLEPDDIANSAAGTDSLWARRNAYDPAKDLAKFRGPVLAIYGGDDEVVVASENEGLMKNLTRGRATVAVIPGAGHGLSMSAAARDHVMAFLQREKFVPAAAP